MGSYYGDSQIEHIKSPLSVAARNEREREGGGGGGKEEQRRKEASERSGPKYRGKFNRSWLNGWDPATC